MAFSTTDLLVVAERSNSPTIAACLARKEGGGLYREGREGPSEVEEKTNYRRLRKIWAKGGGRQGENNMQCKTKYTKYILEKSQRRRQATGDTPPPRVVNAASRNSPGPCLWSSPTFRASSNLRAPLCRRCNICFADSIVLEVTSGSQMLCLLVVFSRTI